MTLTTAEMNDLWSRLAEDIPNRGLLVFPGAIKAEGRIALWPPDGRVEEFLDLAQELEVRLVYLSCEELNSEALLEIVASMLEDPGSTYETETPEAFFETMGLATDQHVGEFLGFGRARYGRRSTITVEWSHGGIVHRFIVVANWLGRLLDMASEIGDLVESQQKGH